MTPRRKYRECTADAARKRFYPFNAEQTINILSEFGPLVTMFIVNAFCGINDRDVGADHHHDHRDRRDALRVSPAAGISVDRLDRSPLFSAP